MSNYLNNNNNEEISEIQSNTYSNLNLNYNSLSSNNKMINHSISYNEINNNENENDKENINIENIENIENTSDNIESEIETNKKKFAKTFYNPNITPKFPIGDYLNQQIKNKTEKFDKLHKLAFEEHIKRRSSNLNIPKFKNKKIVEISPNSHLFFTKKPTYKSLYDIESKTRDILIASKLKNEYCTQDINRILRGYRPWIEEDIQ